jgi:heme exporter protein A
MITFPRAARLQALVASFPSPPAPFTGHGLACRRGDRLIFRDLDLSLAPGGALLLTGRNGSGKSSLLRLLAGLTPALAGELRWAGVAVTEDAAAHRARLHFVGHLDAVKPVFSVQESLAFWAGMRGGTPNAVGPALARFGLAELATLPCRFLSAGQRRRLALARLIVSPAPLWLLDEPATGLDQASMTVLASVLVEHRAEGGLVIASTHQELPLPGAQSLALDALAARQAA